MKAPTVNNLWDVLPLLAIIQSQKLNQGCHPSIAGNTMECRRRKGIQVPQSQ